MFEALLLLAGVVWLYFWLRGNWFAAVLGLPVGAYIFLTLRAWSVPPGAPFTHWQWIGLLLATLASALPLCIHQGLAEYRVRKNILGITLDKQADANFHG